MWILLLLHIKPHKLHLTDRFFPTLLHYFPRMLIARQNSLSYWKSKQFQLNKIKIFLSISLLSQVKELLFLVHSVWYQQSCASTFIFPKSQQQKNCESSFTPWLTCLPEKIIMNSVTAKTSRLIRNYIKFSLKNLMKNHVECLGTCQWILL